MKAGFATADVDRLDDGKMAYLWAGPMARWNQTRAEEKNVRCQSRQSGSRRKPDAGLHAGRRASANRVPGRPAADDPLDPPSSRRLADRAAERSESQRSGTTEETHCSAFVAAVALMLDIYILRAPHHGQNDLANAQADWLAGGAAFGGPTAKDAKWIALGSSGDAAALKAAVDAANLGRLVVGFYRAAPGSDGKPVPGHAVIVLPQSAAAVGDDGPRVMSVADVNRPDTTMRTAFHAHPEAWPDRIALYAHVTDLEKDST